MSEQKEPIPLDVFHRILSFVPATETSTLATLLRLDKSSCLAVAPKLYTHLRITPDVDVLVDTGLPTSILYGSSCDFDTSFKGLVEGNELAREPKQNEGEGDPVQMDLQRGQTLKACFLDFIRTIDVVHHSPPYKLPVNIISKGQSQRRLTPLLHLDRVTIHLDTCHPTRMPPFAIYHTPNSQTDPACISLLQTVRPRRLIINGASFTMTIQPYFELPLGLLGAMEEIVVLITGGAIPERDFAEPEYGPSDIYQALVSRGLHRPSSATPPLPRATAITFLLETFKPTDRLKIIHRPHSGMPMTMEYHPDYAPGYLNALTVLLARNISMDWKKAIDESATSKNVDKRRQVNFVNFGSLDGEELGMPQAAKEEIEDRFRRGMDIRMKQNVSRMGTFDGMEIGDTWREDVRVMGMKEWLEEDAQRKDVLDERVREGWI